MTAPRTWPDILATPTFPPPMLLLAAPLAFLLGAWLTAERLGLTPKRTVTTVEGWSAP